METKTLTNELVIAGIDFDRIIRSMSESNEVFLTGTLARNHFDHVGQWVLRSVAVADQTPSGSQHGLLRDWFVVDRVVRSGNLIDYYRDRFAPLPGQRLVILAIGDGDDHGKWHCGIYHRGTHRMIDRVRVVGMSNLILNRTPDDRMIDDIQDLRWTRLRNVFGDKAFGRIRDTHVMIFGASRTGSTAARQLAALGVGKLTLVDPDVLEPHNFDAMLGGNTADIGRHKVSALADELIRFRDDIAVTGLPWTATDRRVIARARSADILMTCVDHGTPVLLAAKMANKWNKVHIDVGTSVQFNKAGGLDIHGDVRLFYPHEACALCVGGIGDQLDAQIDMLLPPGAMTIRPKSDFREQRAGSLVTVNTFAVSVATQMLCESITTPCGGSKWQRIDLLPTGGQLASLRVSRGANCTICEN